MFWNYSLTPFFYVPTNLPMMGFPTTNFSEQYQNKDENIYEVKLSQNGENKKQMLYISAQDLINAGYQVNKFVWTQEEDLQLRKFRDQQNLQWSKIAQLMEGRNSKMCYSRYRRLENNTKEIWRKADDELLLKLVSQLGDQWKQISKHFPKRTHKQIKQHYNNYLKDGINRNEWTLEEDLKLVDLLNKFGREWKIIEELFPGRTQNQIKNRYFGRLKRISEKNLSLKQKAKMQLKKKLVF